MNWTDNKCTRPNCPCAGSSESKEEVRAPGSIDQRDGFGISSAHGRAVPERAQAAPSEKQELPPLTDYEMADAFEWLRGMALGTSVASRRAYVALRAWSELKAAQSAKQQSERKD